MSWTVTLSRKADKQQRELPTRIREALVFLVHEITRSGPIRGDWPNYGKLGPRTHHCHLKKGKPTYVVVWEVAQDDVKLVEITYVGTHEKAPY